MNASDKYQVKELKTASAMRSSRFLWQKLLLLFAALVTLSAPAQIQQAWVARYNNGITNGTNQAVKMVLDSTGNVYITGFSQNTNTNRGYVTIKYAPNGNQLWATRYDSTNYPSATPSALALDNSNNVIVTGSALTVKYNANGHQMWTAPYAGTALVVDTNGNIGLAGFGTSFNSVKLGPSGSNVWLQTYPASCGTAMSQAIIADTSGNFYVAGNYPFGCDPPINYELLIIKYGSNGNPMWTSTYAIQPDPFAQVQAAALDSANNLYLEVNFVNVQPYTVFEYTTDGSLTYVVSLGQSGISVARGLALDSNGNTVLTGQLPYKFTGTESYCYGTFGLNSNGSPTWTNRFPQPAVGSSVANSVAIDSANNSYVTGYSPSTNSLNDIVTIKYGPNGNQVWLQRYNGPGNGNAAGNAIAVDNNGDVYVTGYDTTAAGGTEIVTIKYSPLVLQKQPNGSILLQAQGYAGESFDIQASADLFHWLDLGSVTADTNGLMQFDDTNAANFPARFYDVNPQ